MQNPQISENASRKVRRSLRIALAYSTISAASAILLPEASTIPIIAASPPIIGAIVYLNRDQFKIEKDAYDDQQEASSKMVRNPFIFTLERG